MTISMSRRIAAEFAGTGFLVAAVVGSGIMGERLSDGNVAFGAAREHGCHRRGPGRTDPNVWSNIRSAL